jgi:hypothetical protein
VQLDGCSPGRKAINHRADIAHFEPPAVSSLPLQRTSFMPGLAVMPQNLGLSLGAPCEQQNRGLHAAVAVAPKGRHYSLHPMCDACDTTGGLIPHTRARGG